ncbi:MULTISPECIES: tripartite tricarboxylate transporter substrate binding protein [unclassified Cupriavidus]|uniref:Bug family tripartite tricarboxylate transporter substrate binding protein n=1 Tax=unclassified Cupriavidus TaxID=2640874 RepID=UPI001055BB72|nr:MULTISPECIES: tripartite tricarboxylate transporter substrate binding protein [unclassified Cupriavidus]MBF6989239.1 tripartite tricarboxylate transporter substrate binding protein [Cupriavidus sp. IK-TO18]TDF67264.1 tripartite tricarboxylate transporter substrate binding protein [Cupriavidus sp. L7L]
MKWKALLGAVALAVSAAAQADSYPSRPITFVVPAAAGGAVDSIARALAEVVGRQMGQPVIVDNKPGAGGMLGTQYVARAAPDGYTVLVTASGPVLTAPFMYAKVPYDVRRDLTFVSQICTGQLVLAVNPQKVPAKTVKEFMAWAQQHKGSVTYGSYGVGSAAHLMGSYFSESNRLDMTHVAYKGESPMVQDLIGGQLDWAIGTVGVMAPHIQNGRLRPLAVLGDRRPAELPNVPTMSESGFPQPEYRPVGWAAMLAPANVPPAVLARLEQEVRAAVQTTSMKARFQIFGMYALGTSAAEFRRDFDATVPVTERLIRASGARID